MTTSPRPTIGLMTLVVVAAIAISGCGSDTSQSTHGPGHATMRMGTETETGDHAMHGEEMGGTTGLVAGADGTRASAAGLSLRPESSRFGAHQPSTWAFTIRDAHGMPVTRFERDQTKLLHLIVVRSDLTRYQHLHPTLGKAGRFTIPITLPSPGRYRAIADFTTGGKRYALGSDITAPGSAKLRTLPPAAPTTTTDGYTVRLDHGPVRAGRTTALSFTVSRDGRAVTELRRYLGAYGHLVALRHPDIAYSHVHPIGQQLHRGKITFDAELPTAGSYGLFVQFRAGGRVHTAPFTVVATKT